jgi:hypothetical protein
VDSIYPKTTRQYSRVILGLILLFNIFTFIPR